MHIILDNYPIPEQGQVNINVRFSFEINIDALEARKVVSSWLLNEVSYMVGAGNATLVLSNRPTWRVPAWIAFPGVPQKDIVGVVDVDVQTGEILNPTETKARLEHYLEKVIRPDMMPSEFVVRELPPDYIVDLDPVPQQF
ncbi:MAG: hypothetical protein WAM60_22460 [Candidatus Promineifilaceae bacterium]